MNKSQSHQRAGFKTVVGQHIVHEVTVHFFCIKPNHSIFLTLTSKASQSQRNTTSGVLPKATSCPEKNYTNWRRLCEDVLPRLSSESYKLLSRKLLFLVWTNCNTLKLLHGSRSQGKPGKTVGFENCYFLCLKIKKVQSNGFVT